MSYGGGRYDTNSIDRAAEEECNALGVESWDDPVNHPPHYTSGGIETLDFIRCKKLDYLAGNVVKYIVRHRIKGNPLQDLQKARFYLNRMIQEEEEDGTAK